MSAGVPAAGRGPSSAVAQPAVLLPQRSLRILLFLTAVILLQACGGGDDPALAYRDDPEALQRGEAVFVGTCSAYCHQVGMEVGDVPNLFDCEWIHGGSDRDIFDTIRNGVPGTRMVAFQDRLPDGEEDIWKIVAFLKTRAPDC